MSAKVDFPASASEILSLSLQVHFTDNDVTFEHNNLLHLFRCLQFVQLLREGFTDLRVFEELNTQPSAFSTAAPDVDKIVCDRNLQSHYTKELYFAPRHICLVNFVLEDYVSADACLSEDVTTGRRDYLTFLMNRCENDDDLKYRIYWQIRSAAISLNTKSYVRVDLKSDNRCIDSCLYYVVQALIVLTGRFLLSPPTNHNPNRNSFAQSHIQNIHSSSSHLHHSRDSKGVLNSINQLFAPFALVISAHDDLTALFAILRNKLSCRKNKNTSQKSAETSTGDCVEGDINYLYSGCNVDQESARQVNVDRANYHSQTNTLIESPKFNDSDLSNSVQNDWNSMECCDTWRTVVSPTSLLTASTVMLLCHPSPNTLITDTSCQEVARSYSSHSHIAFARSLLNSKEQLKFDTMVTTAMEMNRKYFTVDPGICTNTAGSPHDTVKEHGSDLLQIDKQCRLLDAIRAAIQSVTKSSLILSETHNRRNERFQEALRTHIGPGSFGSNTTSTINNDSNIEQHGCVTQSLYTSKAIVSLEGMNSDLNETSVVINTEVRYDTNKQNSPRHIDFTSASKEEEKDEESVYPILSPLHPQDVLIIGMDINKVIRCTHQSSNVRYALIYFNMYSFLTSL